MMNVIWFADDKLSKFCYCSHKNAQNDNFYTFVGIAQPLHTFQQDSAPARTACEMIEFLKRETTDFMSPHVA